MPSSDFESIIAGFNAMQSGWGEGTTPEAMRADFEAWCERFPDDRPASITRVSAGGVPADQIEPPGLATSRVVLLLPRRRLQPGLRPLAPRSGKRIAFAARARVVLPDYRLAPEHVFPAAVEDAVASYRWLLATGVPPERIAVGGDSAGAGLALALLVSLRDAGAPLPACAVLLSPFADLECRGETYSTLADLDPIVSREMGLGMGRVYIGDRAPRVPLASPVHAAPPACLRSSSRWGAARSSSTTPARSRGTPGRRASRRSSSCGTAWCTSGTSSRRCSRLGPRAIADLGSFIRGWTKD